MKAKSKVLSIALSVLMIFSMLACGMDQAVYAAQKDKGKQVFMAYDTLDSYGADTRQLIEKHAVLELSPGGNELFGWAWNKEKDDEAGEQD